MAPEFFTRKAAAQRLHVSEATVEGMPLRVVTVHGEGNPMVVFSADDVTTIRALSNLKHLRRTMADIQRLAPAVWKGEA